ARTCARTAHRTVHEAVCNDRLLPLVAYGAAAPRTRRLTAPKEPAIAWRVSETSRSLVRFGGRLKAVAPMARRLLGSAASGVDDWMTGKLGEEFGGRLARVPLNLKSTGVDPF